MSNLIQAHDLQSRLGDDDLRIVDVRFDLKDPEAGRQAYRRGHLPGALYFHLDEVLSSRPATHGGRHPLPDMDAFAATLAAHGIGDGDRVVIYDDSGGMFAGRLWWLLRYAGHDRVQLLDGGIDAWTGAGFDLDGDVPEPAAATFTLRLRRDMVVDRDYLLRHLGDPDVLIVDARAPERYRGEVEPIDPRAGHIPSALNLPFAGNLEGGRFKGVEALRERFAVLDEADEVVVYCGSGVSAAHNLLALDEIGVDGVRLYPGSWSDWSSYDDAPVATGDEDAD